MGRFSDIYRTREWRKVRRAVLTRDNGLCVACLQAGRIRAGKEIDHIMPINDENQGNWNIVFDTNNLQTLCSEHHNKKHGRTSGLSDFVSPPVT